MNSMNYNLRGIEASVFDVDGVLSCDVIPPHPNDDPMRTVNIKDGYALQLTVKRGYEVAMITGGYTEAVQIRFPRLGIQRIYMCSAVKVHDFKDLMEKMGLSPEYIVYTGDDIPDYEAMMRVGLLVTPADTAPEVKEIAKYISFQRGSEDVARDAIEQTMRT